MLLQKTICSLWLICLAITLTATAPTLLAPADQALNVSKTPILEWSGTAASYTIELYACNPDEASTGMLGLDNFNLSAGPTDITEIYGDLSGLTYNSSTNTFFAPTNGTPMIFELDLNGNFIRSISLFGFQDTEGLVWVGGDDYFVIEERKGRAVKISINATTTTIIYPTEYIQLPGTWGNNLGLEGVTYNPATNELIIIKEKFPLDIYAFEIPANLSDPITVTTPFDIATNNFGFTDLSGLHHLGMTAGLNEMNVSDHFLILSHESKALVETDETGFEYSRLDLDAGGANNTLADALFQAEGVSADNEGNIYVVSEPNTFYKFANPSIDLTPFNTTTLAFSDNAATGSSLTVPAGMLNSNTEYCWRVKDNDTGEWSAYRSFTTVPNAAPTVEITVPTDGAVFTDLSPISITANANDADGTIAQVQYFVNSIAVGIGTGPGFAIDYTPFAQGTYNIYAIATDDEGAFTTSATISISIDFPNQAPNIDLTDPMDGATFPFPPLLPLSANANDPDGNIAQVEFFVDNVSVGTTSSGSPYTLSFIPTFGGTYTIYAIATDNEGATTTSNSAEIIIYPPNQPPNVTIISPVDGLILNTAGSINIIADADDPDGSIAQVQFFVSGNLVATVTTPPYTTTHNLVTNGTYCISAIATDDQGTTDLSSTVCVELYIVNNINEADFFADFKLFPNPAPALLNVSFNAITPLQDARLSVYDQHGKQVLTNPLSHSSGQYNQTFNVNHLAIGTYMLTIEQDGQVLARRNFVKSNN